MQLINQFFEIEIVYYYSHHMKLTGLDFRISLHLGLVFIFQSGFLSWVLLLSFQLWWNRFLTPPFSFLSDETMKYLVDNCSVICVCVWGGGGSYGHIFSVLRFLFIRLSGFVIMSPVSI